MFRRTPLKYVRKDCGAKLNTLFILFPFLSLYTTDKTTVGLVVGVLVAIAEPLVVRVAVITPPPRDDQ